ncbi:MAG TPA: hypothetical protein ENO21_03860 [Firmicutes bacterium]|nr:hypothetical protein [Bacillota bacterium]
MSCHLLLVDPAAGFWITNYAITITVISLVLIVWLIGRMRRIRRLTWEIQTEYIDVSEFSNRNIPLRVTYKGEEPRWMWATYLAIKNTGNIDVTSEDFAAKEKLIIGNKGARYIGFNRIISEKAKVTLNPLFETDSVYCSMEFDRLGPGDEVLVSLLFVADNKIPIEASGELFGQRSTIVSGYRYRQQSWRLLWWLLIIVITLGIIGAIFYVDQAMQHRELLRYHFQILLVLYFLALGAAAVLLRPIRFKELSFERLYSGRSAKRASITAFLRFLFGASDEF